MKKLMLLACTSILVIGCNNQAATKEAVADTAVAEKIDYAYLPADHPADYWDRGDQKNVALVLSSLKAFENGKVDECLAAFADSINWSAENLNGKISKDSLRSVLKGAWSNLSAVKIKMEDYEAVISKDKKVEYVTLWYKEIMTDKAGKTDSVFCVDDARIENGKISSLDEYTRKLAAKK